MGYGIAGGVVGIILMFGAWKWLTSYATTHGGGSYIPTIGSRPRRLAGVPEEAPADAKMPPGMEVLRHGADAVQLPAVEETATHQAPDAAHAAESGSDAPPAVETSPAIVEAAPTPSEAESAPVAVEPESDDVVVTEEVVTIIEGADSGIIISEIHHGDADQGEYVRIENTGPNPVALEQWRLTDEGDKHEYSFLSLILQPGTSLRVHMWRGEDTETDVYVGRRNNWWNDGGDTVYLYDAAGVLVHSLVTRTVDDEE